MTNSGKLLSILIAGVFGYAVSASATPISGTLYYTTFAGGVNVHSVNYNYDGSSSFSLSGDTGIASTFGADGLLFAPDGNLVIAGQGSNQLHEITTGGAAVNTVNAGTGSYHMALSSNSSTATLYNLWNGFGGGGSTSISAATLSGGGLSTDGVAYSVGCTVGTACNTDVRGLAYNPNNGTWYYGTAGDGASGTFGTVVFDDTSHTATLTQLLNDVFAHGLTFDSFTNDIIFSSANTISQFDPTSGTIVSSFSGPGNFDQSAVDGNGHLFVASNSGYLQFIDYSASGLVGTTVYSAAPFLASALDDIAPLSGAGACTGPSCTVPEPGELALLGIGTLGLALVRRRKKS